MTHNVSRGLRIPKRKVELQRRRAFTTQELVRIFVSSVYTKDLRYRAGGGETSVWVSMLAFVTGAVSKRSVSCESPISSEGYRPLMHITD